MNAQSYWEPVSTGSLDFCLAASLSNGEAYGKRASLPQNGNRSNPPRFPAASAEPPLS